MKVRKGYVVLEHCDGQILGAQAFHGKNSLAEAKKRFKALVVEDLTDPEADPGDRVSKKDAIKIAESEAEGRQGCSYTSEDGAGDYDIMLVELD